MRLQVRPQDLQGVTTVFRFETGLEGASDAATNKETIDSGAAPRRLKARARAMTLTRRDVEIVRWVQLVGLSTRDQLQKLFFGPGGRSRCQHRLTLLFRHRYLDRFPDRIRNRPDIYCVSRRSINGLRLLRASGVAAPLRPLRADSLRLQHALDLVSCRVQVSRACAETGVTIVGWMSSEELISDMAATGILPDAYFQLCRITMEGQEKRSAFFLEVERSDKSERALKEKFRRYGDFYYRGGFERTFGARALRVLVLIGSDYGILPERRVEKLAGLAEQVGVTFLRLAPLAAFLGASPKEVLTSRIWRRPGEVVASSLFQEPTEGTGRIFQ